MVPGMSDDRSSKRDSGQDINNWMNGKGNPILLGAGAVLVIAFVATAFGL